MSATPPLESSRSSLQNALHAATRQQHMILNQSITQRLPLCLPPHTNSPCVYAKGMAVFGSIFTAFETAMNDAIENVSENPDQERHTEILRRVHTNGLRRSDKIRQDLATLHSRMDKESQQEVYRLRQASRVFEDRIQASITNKPHVALAYSWTMYLALFNGGRWLLKQLTQPGSEFWEDSETADSNNIDVLSFWHFDDSIQPEGEDLKTAFKTNFDAATQLLTDDECNDIIAEARAIFDLCAEMVELLDREQMHTRTAEPKMEGTTGYLDRFPTIAHMWRTVSSAATVYLAPSLLKPLREEVRPMN